MSGFCSPEHFLGMIDRCHIPPGSRETNETFWGAVTELSGTHEPNRNTDHISEHDDIRSDGGIEGFGRPKPMIADQKVRKFRETY